VSAVKYELRFYIPADGILHSHGRENLKSYMLRILVCSERKCVPMGRLAMSVCQHIAATEQMNISSVKNAVPWYVEAVLVLLEMTFRGNESPPSSGRKESAS
jgi:hypothetical protein